MATKKTKTQKQPIEPSPQVAFYLESVTWREAFEKFHREHLPGASRAYACKVLVAKGLEAAGLLELPKPATT